MIVSSCHDEFIYFFIIYQDLDFNNSDVFHVHICPDIHNMS